VRIWGHLTTLTPPLFKEVPVSNLYVMCFRGIVCTCFYNFRINFGNCFDGVDFFLI
jgi:hypothetical protein